MVSNYYNTLSYSIVEDIKTFTGIRNVMANVEISVRDMRSTVINIKSYVDPLVEVLDIAGFIPSPRDKTKKQMKSDLNSLLVDIINQISTPLNLINKSLTFVSSSLEDLIFIFNKSTNYMYEKIKEGVDFDIDDDSVLATLEKHSTQIIGTITTMFKTMVSVMNRNYSYLTEVLNSLISSVSAKIAGVINSSVEVDDPMSPEELQASVNVVLGATVVQPLISSLENSIINRVYDCTGQLRKVGDNLGKVLRWNFTEL